MSINKCQPFQLRKLNISCVIFCTPTIQKVAGLIPKDVSSVFIVSNWTQLSLITGLLKSWIKKQLTLVTKLHMSSHSILHSPCIQPQVNYLHKEHVCVDKFVVKFLLKSLFVCPSNLLSIGLISKGNFTEKLN